MYRRLFNRYNYSDNIRQHATSTNSQPYYIHSGRGELMLSNEKGSIEHKS